MDAYLAIASRREVRSYAERAIPDEVVERILQAGRLTGSAGNSQPWRFIVVQEAVEAAAEAVYEPDNLRGAALVVAVATSGRGPTGFDAGRAAQNMMLAAWNEGVGSCPNGVADHDRLHRLLGLREEEKVSIVLSFGYPARPVDPASRSPEEWTARARRKPLDEIVERA